jgi:uncharacterized Zn-binding protein involved in type VI secretion
MKLPAAIEGDLCTGHDDYPPRPGKASSSGVFVNGKAVHVTGDQWGKHCNPESLCHEGVVIGGSVSVLVNGKPLARAGDAISCGSKISGGSGSVFVG